ncbi:hypothetical protein BH24BAC1_BH24BAC1_34110 [soil metagenome]
MKRLIKYVFGIVVAGVLTAGGCTSLSRPQADPDRLALAGQDLQVTWQKTDTGWSISSARARGEKDWVPLGLPSGEYTLLYSAARPDSTPVRITHNGKPVNFPEESFKYIIHSWERALRPVPMNTAGQAIHFFPSTATQVSPDKISFRQEEQVADIAAEWSLDPHFSSDLLVELTLTAKQDGYFSLATPTLATVAEQDLTWGILPGYFQGKVLQKDFVLAYAYGQGIPDRPVVVRERTVSTLAPLVSGAGGITLAVIPEPGLGRDPWEKDKNTHHDWRLGLSLMNRKGQLSPTAYYPVLGEKGSWLKAGEQVSYRFRYSAQVADWFDVYKHAIYDVYKFKDFLDLKETRQSLCNRIEAMHRYVTDDETSMWNVENFEGLKIGAQSYLGGVVGADKDAIKNSDYGAMWMLGTIASDPVLRQTRLPYARNFKLKQQHTSPGFLQGAAEGQYYLTKSRKFVEEWGSHVEPISLTYYTMLDMGNILLFEPQDQELRERLRLGAERLLAWQHPDGSWDLAYDRSSRELVYSDLDDLRPTFYGLIVAYRILGDQKYLEAARRGADWFVERAVNEAHFTGVCGDVRFVNDFATGQSAQAFLDLYDLTQDARYREAAIEAARIYTASIYTHPIASRQLKIVKGEEKQDWQISQVGLSFEHGGTIGSATSNGPIPLASHAGMFLRVHRLTGEPLFRDMARAAALGRDAHVDPKTSVASYYWQWMDRGPGSFPHHAWWQIGWIADYLLAEAEVRSEGKVIFPRGFITPKVGPHQSYGFAPGKIFGQEAALRLFPGLVQADTPNLDYITALAPTGNRLYVVLLNSQAKALPVKTRLDPTKLLSGQTVRWKSASLISPDGTSRTLEGGAGEWQVSLPGFGLAVLAVEY